MALLDQVNDGMQQLGAGEDAAQPPRVQFLDKLEYSYTAQNKTGYRNAADYAMEGGAERQSQALRDVGEMNVPHLQSGSPALSARLNGYMGGNDSDDQNSYFDSQYRQAQTFYRDGGDQAEKQALDDYDNRIEELKVKYPQLGLKNSGELFQDTAREAQEAAKNDSLPTTFGGKIGGFIGSAASFMNLKANPMGPLAGLGAVVAEPEALALQFAKEAGVMGGEETVDQLSGAQETRRLLGLPHGISEAATAVAGAAAGGLIAKGIHLGVVSGYNRYFKASPGDVPPPPDDFANPAQPTGGTPPPPPNSPMADLFAQPPRPYHQGPPSASPLGDNPIGRMRQTLDQQHVENQLQDWRGPAPSDVRPPMMTAPPRPVTDFTQPDIREQLFNKQIDGAARQVDPDLFNKYDQLRQTKQDFASVLETQRPTVAEAESTIPDIMDRMDDLKDKIANANARKTKIYQAELDQLEALRQQHIYEQTKLDSPDMNLTRRLMMKADENMRDLAPSIGRAYAQARGDWNLSDKQWADVRWMVSKGETTLPPADLGGNPFMPKNPVEPEIKQPVTATDTMPILKQAPQVEGNVNPNADAIEYAKQILKKNKEHLDEALESYRGLTRKMLSDEEGKADIMGEKFNLDRDTIHVPNSDGNGSRQITLRQLLQEQDDIEAQAKAVDKCSI